MKGKSVFKSDQMVQVDINRVPDIAMVTTQSRGVRILVLMDGPGRYNHIITNTMQRLRCTHMERCLSILHSSFMHLNSFIIKNNKQRSFINKVRD